DPRWAVIGVATGRLQGLLAEILVDGVVSPDAVEDVPRPRAALAIRQVVGQRGDLGQWIDRARAQLVRHVVARETLAEDVVLEGLELVDDRIGALVPQLHLLDLAVELAPALEAVGSEPAAIDATLPLGQE